MLFLEMLFAYYILDLIGNYMRVFIENRFLAEFNNKDNKEREREKECIKCALEYYKRMGAR